MPKRKLKSLGRGWWGQPRRHSIAAKLGHKRRRNKLPSYNYNKLKGIHRSRRRVSRRRDIRTTSKVVIPKEKVTAEEHKSKVHSWTKDQSRSDIQGIDTKKTGKEKVVKTTKKEPKTEKEKFMATVSKDDIDLKTTTRAYSGVYTSPERVAQNTQMAYVQDMESVYNDLSRYAKTPEQKRILLEELERYRKNYLNKRRDLIHKHSSLVSWFIAGPAKYPKARQEKLSRQYDTKYANFLEWQEKAQKSIKRKIKAGLTEDEKTGELLTDIERDIREANLKQWRGEKAPAWLRNNAKARITGKVDTLVYNGEVEKVEQVLNKLEDRGVFTKKHRIWKLAEKAKKYKPPEGVKEETVFKFSQGEVVNNYEVDRLQIRFDGKPPASVRSDLKRWGFRWSPKNMAWQRKISTGAKVDAKSVLKKHYEE